MEASGNRAGGCRGPRQRDEAAEPQQTLFYRPLWTHRAPSHISKTVLSTVHFGPPEEARTPRENSGAKITEPPATSQRWFCLPSTLAHRDGLEPTSSSASCDINLRFPGSTWPLRPAPLLGPRCGVLAFWSSSTWQPRGLRRRLG